MKAITKYIEDRIPEPPELSIILGSGLGDFIDELEKKIFIPYSEIPNYPVSSVSGHAGQWVFGYIHNKPVLCANGRFHVYEGFTLEESSITVSVIQSLGCRSVIITNAAGCLNANWEIGNLMLIKGYLDYTFRENSNDPKIIYFGQDDDQHQKVKKSAEKFNILLRDGIYTWTLGPNYETPAEIEDIISMGGNAVGMSTVPEIMKAIELDMNILGISCLTNFGAGIEKKILSHKDVLKVSNSINKKLSKLLIEIIKN